MKFIIATKLEMSQRFKEDGTVVPVTLLKAEPCKVTQIKSNEKDGYESVQIGCGVEKHPSKPEAGHTKELGQAFKILREFRTPAGELKVGDTVDLSQFATGEFVEVEGTSKGKGFQGVVKRHHFAGGPASHGQKDQLRMPGSIAGGGRNGKGRVVPGMRMAGRMGGDQITVKNLQVVEVDATANVIAVKGAVPGARGAIIMVSGGTADKQAW